MAARGICHRAIARAVVGGATGRVGVVGVETGVGPQLQHHRAWSRASTGAIGVTTSSRDWSHSSSSTSPSRAGGFVGGELFSNSTHAAATSGRGGRFVSDGSRAAHSAAGNGANAGWSHHRFSTAAKAASWNISSGGDHEAPVNPFTIVNDELNAISARMRTAVTSEVPALATAAEYFFKVGAEGKRMRPTVLLLLASALTDVTSGGGADAAVRARADFASIDHAPAHVAPGDTRRRQQRLAEITELIHVASLLHDDVLDSAATRRGLRALNLEVGNKLAILAGDFLLARASVTLASLRNTEVIELLSRVLEHLVTGEVMQMTAKADKLVSFDHYFKKTYLKTASLIANSAKAIVLLGGHDAEVAQLAYEYGRHLGLAFQFQDDVLDFVGSGSVLGKPTLGDLREGIATAPVLFAAEEFAGLTPLIGRRFKNSGDVELAAGWVRQSQGIERTKAMAREHSALAVKAIEALPAIDCPHALRCRDGLKELAYMAVNRIK